MNERVVDVAGGFTVMAEDVALNPVLVLVVECATQLVAKGFSEHAAVSSVLKIWDETVNRLTPEDA